MLERRHGEARRQPGIDGLEPLGPPCPLRLAALISAEPVAEPAASRDGDVEATSPGMGTTPVNAW